MKNRKDLFKSVDYLLMGSTASSKHDGSNISDSQREMLDGSEIDKSQYAEFEEAFTKMKKQLVSPVLKRLLQDLKPKERQP